jgi:hypothetical protein
VVAPDKKIIFCTFRIRGTLVFLCPKVRERERARARARASARKRKVKTKTKTKRKIKIKTKIKIKRKREKKKCAGEFISKPPGQNENSVNYSVQERVV